MIILQPNVQNSVNNQFNLSQQSCLARCEAAELPSRDWRGVLCHRDCMNLLPRYVALMRNEGVGFARRGTAFTRWMLQQRRAFSTHLTTSISNSLPVFTCKLNHGINLLSAHPSVHYRSWIIYMIKTQRMTQFMSH